VHPYIYYNIPYLEKRISLLKDLYNMSLYDMGQHAVLSTFSQLDGLSYLLSLLEPPPEFPEVRASSVSAQFAAYLLLLVVQSDYRYTIARTT
jgi:hypothetical protein